MQPGFVRDVIEVRRHAAAVRAVGPDLLHLLDRRALPVAVRAVDGAPRIVADPSLHVPDALDVAWAVPGDPELAPPPRGWAADHHFPTDDRSWDPLPGRHVGMHVYLCYHRTGRNPGRYLEAALERAGVRVTRVEDVLEWESMSDPPDAVVFVESPLPPIDVVGRNPGVPVAFWVHHGEHHLEMNVRLCRRYGVDVVLLAHSWHLAHRFPIPVVRFPFAVAPERFGPGPEVEDRPFDVAFVGSNLAGQGPYTRRRALLDEIRESLPPDRIELGEGVTPRQVGDLYRSARIVPNEGGTRHRPITMRVFEAIGCGAVLLSEPAPGLERLFEQGQEYVELSREDVGEQVARLLADPSRLERIRRAAADKVRARHTYDHRVDDLLEVIRRTLPGAQPETPDRRDLIGLVAADPEVQRIVTDDATLAEAWPDREVWHVDQIADRLEPDAYEAAVISDPSSIPVLVDAAWRYVYAPAGLASEAVERVVEGRKRSNVERFAGGLRVDLMPDSYRL